jgi:hypothetical protein
MKKGILLSLFAMSMNVLFAQQHLANDLWSLRLNAGISSFSSKGILPSRNQLNYESVGLGNSSSYKQESRVVALGLEAGLYRSLGKNMRLGILLNMFKDDDEYLSNSDLVSSVSNILTDSLQSLSIRNYQSYANLGLSYEYDYFFRPESKHRLSFAMAVGLAINRTPDRTEFDVFEERNFIQAPVLPEAGDWYITHTKFHNGLFIMPGVSYVFEFSKRHVLHVALASSIHWLASSQQVSLLVENSSGSLDRNSYTLRSTQIKIGYSFTL